ncbi:hypothetical protein PENANT_c090G11329 [Penicillium antarcticum]|uniref:Uncharacterized protein n=1 Tax=Penicillium antarcticum TaxID=416450 RepID=A0A1V6PM52_9EURO|nr:hypothetical protein PENANT_c090G11329 [Penicillium antarcticum]
MSSNTESNGNGVGRALRRQPPVDYNLGRMAKAIESGSKISPAKASAADAQASYTQKTPSENPGTHTPDKSQSVQSQSKPSYNTQEDQARPGGSSEVAAVEPNDQDMPDPEPERETSESPSASSSSSRLTENAAEPDRPAPVGDDDSLDEVLLDLQTLSTGSDRDGEPDAFSYLGRSCILLVRYGPNKAAKYQIQTANGYNTSGLQQVSDTDTRISHVRYRDEGGRKRYRYSRNNIVGIVGVAIYNRKNTAKVYDHAPTTYVKIKWKNIHPDDQALLTRGNCWMTKADLVSLTDQATAEQKISEAWKLQERRYNHWQGQMGRDSPDRSPTPCPLDTFKEQKEERIKREHTNEPSMPIAQSLETDSEVRMLGNRQPVAKNTQRFGSVPVKQESDNEDNELFVTDFSTPGQTTPGQNVPGQDINTKNTNAHNTNEMNKDTTSGPDQSRSSPKLSKYYKKWLQRAQIEETELRNLDDTYFARFEAAAFVYVDELRKKGYAVDDDLDLGI